MIKILVSLFALLALAVPAGAQSHFHHVHATNRGRVIDHVAVSVDDLETTLARLRSEGVTVLSGPRTADGLRSAFVRAPDNMELEIVEGHAKK